MHLFEVGLKNFPRAQDNIIHFSLIGLHPLPSAWAVASNHPNVIESERVLSIMKKK
jgi:hypothetical protein